MNIIFVSHSQPLAGALLENVGGMQRVSMQLEEEFKKNKTVQLNSISQQTDWIWIGIKTFFFLIKLVLVLPYIIRKTKADVVLFSSMVTAGTIVLLRPFVKIPMVAITHGHDVTLSLSLYQWYIKRVFKKLDGVISVSQATLQECLNRGLEEWKGTVLPNGFILDNSLGKKRKDEAEHYFKEKFNLDVNGRFVLLTSGRLVKRKGHSWFIQEVLPKIKSNIVYLIIGDGPEMSNIKSLSNNGSVHILGKQPDEVLQMAYHLADLFMMPNIRVPGDMEGFGIVMLEANNAYTPVIASDLEGIKDVVTEGENGYRIQSEDADAFSAKIDEVLSSNLPELSIRCRNFVEDHFNWKFVALRYIDFLKKVIDQSR